MEENRRERKKRIAREQIEKAALRLFLEKGFNETTIANVMEEADYGTGTFYNYFRSKEDLLNSVVCGRILSIQKDVENLSLQDLPVRERLRNILLLAGKIFEDYKPLIMYFIHLRHTDPSVKVPLQHGAVFKDLLLRLIKEGQKNGEINPDFSAELIMEILHETLQAAMLNPRSKVSISQKVSRKLELIFEGIKPRGGSRNNAD